jgi:hypothetical protein
LDSSHFVFSSKSVAVTDALLHREVLYSVAGGNKEVAICSDFVL